MATFSRDDILLYQGREEGVEQGREEEKMKMAISLAKKGISLDIIAEAAGVSEAVIKEWLEPQKI